MINAKAIGIPMIPSTSLDKDEQGIPVDETKYHGIIGSLLYLIASRSDIIFSVCKCARFQSTPKESHLTAVKRIIRYLIGTVSHGVWYPRSNTFKLEGFSDADLAGDKEDRKSTSGTCQLLSKALISWNNKKQGSFALSTTEAEYIVIGQCYAQLLWISFASMGYMCVKGSWVKKQEGEVKHAQTDSKSKLSASHHSHSNPDFVEKLSAIDSQLSAIKVLLTSTQSTVGDIHAISKKNKA
ncbi:secreted RxLR effector protein 161-like [Nicotiana sylvestris]|uniref:secreted RxLR effector protein 161-like n=1 Tax=Nicotiana sylvestris TaxID=4096 RepID=UPI00388CAEE4